jgi:hypothetical protein
MIQPGLVIVKKLTTEVRNEIAVLKRVSAGHPNIVSLHDFFETTHNLYVSWLSPDPPKLTFPASL